MGSGYRFGGLRIPKQVPHQLCFSAQFEADAVRSGAWQSCPIASIFRSDPGAARIHLDADKRL